MDQNNTEQGFPQSSPVHHSILWRIILYFALASVALSIAASIITVLWHYEQQTESFQQRLEDIRLSYSESLGSSLWFYDEIQIRSQVKGIMNLQAISYVRVTDNLNINIENGKRPHHSDIDTLPISFNGKDIGVLEIAFDRDAVIAEASRAAITTLIALLVSLVLLATMLGLIVHRLINSRISEMASQVNERVSANRYATLSIDSDGKHDEIDILISAFNELSQQMNDQLQQKTAAQQQLKTINIELEDRVKERTQNLQKTVDELNQTLEELHSAQNKLIEAEKLSSLGGMVAGIAHEINTPLGLCITIHSYINDHYVAVRKTFEQGEMRKQDFVEFIGMMEESLAILDKNLQRAAHLIKSFKQVSEDQTGEHIRRFNLLDYINEILETLSPKFKQNKHRVEVDCSDNLWMETFAGSISQVLTNLIMNSLLHGFEHTEEGIIRIQAAEERGNIVIRYSDTGCGLSAEAKAKIFEPFYTTKRGQGGTGLGMHLVYNIISQRLNGEIQIDNSESGAAFRMVLPKVTEEKPDHG